MYILLNITIIALILIGIIIWTIGLIYRHKNLYKYLGLTIIITSFIGYFWIEKLLL